MKCGYHREFTTHDFPYNYIEIFNTLNMHVTLFDQYGALNSGPVFSAIRQGLAVSGVHCSSMDMDADVAVIWSMVWAGRMRSNQAVWQHFRSKGRPVIVAEVGMIQRGHTWKLGLNGTGLTASYGTNLQPNRALSLGLTAKPWKTTGNNIVIACQRTDSEQWTGQPNISVWLHQTIDVIRQHSSRSIIVRPHPRQGVPSVPALLQKPQRVPYTYDSFDFEQSLEDAWCVVNWNSGPGSQAIMAGVPAFVGPTSLAAPVANLDLTQIENPLRPDRDQWLNQLAHTEWTTQELATGMPLRRLLGLESS
jgi:hypothetical protein